jgi:type IV secretory pathway TraG/TraD family ATPase VirD4
MSDRLGNARWEDQAFVAQTYRYAPATFWLGRAEDLTGIGYRDDRHICLVSGSRGGKGTSIIINNLCFWPGSAVVIDPKGENATVTAARRGQGGAHCEGLGQAVHVLDPFKAAQVDDSYRSAFNPLDALDPQAEESIDEASRLANALVV